MGEKVVPIRSRTDPAYYEYLRKCRKEGDKPKKESIITKFKKLLKGEK